MYALKLFQMEKLVFPKLGNQSLIDKKKKKLTNETKGDRTQGEIGIKGKKGW